MSLSEDFRIQNYSQKFQLHFQMSFLFRCFPSTNLVCFLFRNSHYLYQCTSKSYYLNFRHHSSLQVVIYYLNSLCLTNFYHNCCWTMCFYEVDFDVDFLSSKSFCLCLTVGFLLEYCSINSYFFYLFYYHFSIFRFLLIILLFFFLICFYKKFYNIINFLFKKKPLNLVL